MTTESAAPVETAEARLEQIYARLADVRQRTDALAGRAREANAAAAEIRSAPRVACNHSEEVQQLTGALTLVEHELEGLRVAMATRGVIEQAKGMLMLREGCDADTAFTMLVELSQHSHRKLIEVAQTMVATWSAGDRAGP